EVLRLVHAVRCHGTLPHLALPLRALPANDLDLRDAHARSRGRGRGGSGMRAPPIHGLLAEFDTPTQLVTAVRKARAEGYRVMDAYSPFPIEELSEALHFHERRLPLIVLIGGICGGLGGYLLE